MGLDGYAMLAILTLFFVYLFPSLIRSAQVVRDARVEDRFSGALRIVATAGEKPPRVVSDGRTYLHPPRISEHPMMTPVARKLAAADARRVAAARAARAAAASRRAAAAKRRMLLLSVLGAVTMSGWILTAMVSFTWVVPAVLTALTVGVVELGRRAAAAGAKADAQLAEKVRAAEVQAGIIPPAEGIKAASADRAPAADPQKDVSQNAAADSAAATSAPGPSLRVEVDPAKLAEEDEAGSWTPVPVPPPAYTLKAEVRRKVAEPIVVGQQASPVAPSNEDTEFMDPVTEPAPNGAPGRAEPADGADDTGAKNTGADDTGSATTGSLNVQEILARRRAVG